MSFTQFVSDDDLSNDGVDIELNSLSNISFDFCCFCVLYFEMLS